MSRISPLQSSSWWMMAPKRLGVALQSLQIAALVPRSIFRLWAISRISRTWSANALRAIVRRLDLTPVGPKDPTRSGLLIENLTPG